MKKYCLILLLFCALPVCASAQWYLFPGKKKQQKQQQTTVQDTARRIRPDSTLLRPGTDTLSAALGDTLAAADSLPLPDIFVLDIPSVIQVGLILPLQASDKKPSENFLDFYSGALLALRELGEQGLRVELQVFDSQGQKKGVPQSLIEQADVILGPVTPEAILETLPLCGKDKVLISPLDPKAAELAATGPVVQSPSPWTAQVDDLVRWVGQDRLLGPELYLVRDTAAFLPGEQSERLVRKLQERGISYHSVLAVKDIPFQKDQPVHVMVASDRDNFITGVVRNLSIEGARNNNIVLYGTSRIRTNGTSTADLHNTKAHLTTSYFIDYEDPEVKRFILAYRALFQDEPGSFAFQGYDTMYYYVSMCSKYGRQWFKKLDEYEKTGLQSDFRFEEESGRINQAVRRVVYNTDLTTVRQ
ncbi:MAG: hypothetical protein K5849_02205 [Bacteroidales bacterium]|nr:hypothetical protein [Bacteroidales bacterium]